MRAVTASGSKEPPDDGGPLAEGLVVVEQFLTHGSGGAGKRGNRNGGSSGRRQPLPNRRRFTCTAPLLLVESGSPATT